MEVLQVFNGCNTYLVILAVMTMGGTIAQPSWVSNGCIMAYLSSSLYFEVWDWGERWFGCWRSSYDAQWEGKVLLGKQSLTK